MKTAGLVIGCLTFAGCVSPGQRPKTKSATKEAATNDEQQSSAAIPSDDADKPCREHKDCRSGVCQRIKKDYRTCAPTPCEQGGRAAQNAFYCDGSGSWQKAKREGEPCSNSFECYEPSCFMNPMCGMKPREKAACEAGRCKTHLTNVCPEGTVRLLHEEEYGISQDGRCHESMAQRLLRTVCLPCGNGSCDRGESSCNCPKDCSK